MHTVKWEILGHPLRKYTEDGHLKKQTVMLCSKKTVLGI